MLELIGFWLFKKILSPNSLPQSRHLSIWLLRVCNQTILHFFYNILQIFCAKFGKLVFWACLVAGHAQPCHKCGATTKSVLLFGCSQKLGCGSFSLHDFGQGSGTENCHHMLGAAASAAWQSVVGIQAAPLYCRYNYSVPI